MRASILGISSKEQTKISDDIEVLNKLEEPPKVDPIDTETVDQFNLRIHSQDVIEDGYIETNPSVFKTFVGNKPTAYFWYKNIRVYVKGTREHIEANEEIPMERKKFGMS